MTLAARAASAAFVAALAACASAPAPTAAPAPAQAASARDVPGAAPAAFFPLSIGNAWTFVDRSPNQPEASRRTVRIVSRDRDGYFVDDQGNGLRADPDCVHDRSRRLLCGPLERGRRWTSVVAPTVTEHYEIAAVGETVAVPAGTFQGCVRVRSQVRSGATAQVAELVYAPGVGPVRLETFALVEGVSHPQVVGELEAFHVSER